MSYHRLVRASLTTSLFLASAAWGQTIIYVDDGAPAVGDGQAWATAFRHLQDALFSAAETDQVWVARGTYYPDRSENGHATPGDREESFALVGGVALYGGLEGTEDPETFDLGDRDFELSETTLSGDLGVNDGPNFTGNEENSYHVVYSTGVGVTAIFDGFTVSAGNANGESGYFFHMGAGMYNDSSSPTVSNILLTLNWGEYGAGMSNMFSASPTVVDCTFLGNFASGSGGGMYSYGSSADVIRCLFIGNYGWSSGGGMQNDSGSSPKVTSCGFGGNSTDWYGGGMCNNTSSNPTVTNCVLVANEAGYGGGGINNSGSAATLVNCTLVGNSADGDGGGLYEYGGVSPITNCILRDNTSGTTGPQIYYYPSAPVVTYSNVQGGWEGEGNIDSPAMFVDPGLGDFRLLPGSPCIDAGSNDDVTADLHDLDGDGDTDEPIPYDANGDLRFMDDPDTADTGDPGALGPPIVDIGAYELQVEAVLPGDLDHDNDVDLDDFAIIAGCLAGPNITAPPPGCDSGDFAGADLDSDGDADFLDFSTFQSAFDGG